MTIKELKAVLPGSKICGKSMVDAMKVYNALAPEILALVEAANATSGRAFHHPSGKYRTIYVDDSNGPLCDALDAFNAKLASL